MSRLGIYFQRAWGSVVTAEYSRLCPTLKRNELSFVYSYLFWVCVQPLYTEFRSEQLKSSRALTFKENINCILYLILYRRRTQYINISWRKSSDLLAMALQPLSNRFYCLEKRTSICVYIIEELPTLLERVRDGFVLVCRSEMKLNVCIAWSDENPCEVIYFVTKC